MAQEERKIIRKIDWEYVKKEIKNSSKKSSIYIGCDSQTHKRKTIFGLAVIIHIDSSKGGKLFAETSSVNRIKSLRQRLMKEVEIVVLGALNIIDIVGDRHFEIHLDISKDADNYSSIICKEAIGYVTAQGLNCEIKPNAFCATYAADRVVR